MPEFTVDAIHLISHPTDLERFERVFTSFEDATGAAQASGAVTLDLRFVLDWAAAAQEVCCAIDVLAEPGTAADPALTYGARRALAEKMDAWRLFAGDHGGGGLSPDLPSGPGLFAEDDEEEEEAPEPPGQAEHDVAVAKILLAIDQLTVVSQVKAVEMATLRAVRREDVNIASQMRAFARLIGAAAKRSEDPIAFLGAVTKLCAHEFLALAHPPAANGTVGHA